VVRQTESVNKIGGAETREYYKLRLNQHATARLENAIRTELENAAAAAAQDKKAHGEK